MILFVIWGDLSQTNPSRLCSKSGLAQWEQTTNINVFSQQREERPHTLLVSCQSRGLELSPDTWDLCRGNRWDASRPFLHSQQPGSWGRPAVSILWLVDLKAEDLSLSLSLHTDICICPACPGSVLTAQWSTNWRPDLQSVSRYHYCSSRYHYWDHWEREEGRKVEDLEVNEDKGCQSVPAWAEFTWWNLWYFSPLNWPAMASHGHF